MILNEPDDAESEPVFNPAGCDVQYVAPIAPIEHITDCYVKPLPQHMHDCSSTDVAALSPNLAALGLTATGFPSTLGLDPNLIYVMTSIHNVAQWVVQEDWLDLWMDTSPRAPGVPVLLLGNVPGSSWNSTSCQLQTGKGVAPRLVKDRDTGNLTPDLSKPVPFENCLSEAVFMSEPGVGRLGICSNGKLETRDCPDVPLDCICDQLVGLTEDEIDDLKDLYDTDFSWCPGV